MPTCVFRKCHTYTGIRSRQEKVSFHVFPNDEITKQKWIKIVRKQRKEKDWMPTVYSKICSKHFADSDKYTTNNNLRKVKKTAVPFIKTVRTTPNTTQPSQTQTETYDPFQEYANDSTDEDTSDIKEEAESSDENETDDGTPSTAKVFVTSLSDESHVAGQSRPKRSHAVTTNEPDDYEEQLYEFSKYVAEQLLCLGVEDARVAQKEIVAVLTKFAAKRIREPSTPTPIKKSKTVQTVPQTVSSKPQVQVTTQPQFVTVNTAGPSKTTMNITETTVSQQRNICESSSSQTAHVKIEPLDNQSGEMDTPISTQYAMLNVNKVSSPGAPLGYLVVPVRGPQFDNSVQRGSTEIPLVTWSSSSVVSQSSSTVPVTQAESSNIDLPGVALKIEPEFESTHVNVFATEEPT